MSHDLGPHASLLDDDGYRLVSEAVAEAKGLTMTKAPAARLRELSEKATAHSGRGNTGHGHVYPRPDGSRVRCGGPTMCKDCALDFAQKSLSTDARDQIIEQLPAILTALEGVEEMRVALKDARDAIADWGSYAGEYFQAKHDLLGDLAKIDAVLQRAALKEKP